MQVYEIGYHIVPSVPEEKLTTEVEAIHASIKKNDGTIITEDFPKLRELSYTMTKTVESKNHNYDEAYFGWIKVEMPVAKLAAVEADVKGMVNVLRYIIVKTIRENTMFSEVLPAASADKAEGAPEGAEVKKTSDEEIDKSIDALVIN